MIILTDWYMEYVHGDIHMIQCLHDTMLIGTEQNIKYTNNNDVNMYAYVIKMGREFGVT